jgi:TolB-like protein/Flp pilus assembly protein TadD
MPNNPNRLSRFWQELKRRKVVRVITVYAAAAFVIIELINNVTEPLKLPDWTPTLVIILLFIGFIFAILLSWIYDIIPEGVEKTKPVPEQGGVHPEKPSQLRTWKIATYVSIVVIIGLIFYNIFGTKRSIDLSGLDRTIAVLPFEIVGQDNSTNSLKDALPIALISELMQVEGFTIRHWGSSRNYSELEQRSIQIGEEINVNFLLNGFLLQQGKEVEVDIMLIVAATEVTIWSEHYTIQTEDALRVRRDIARQVALALENRFDPEQYYLSENPDAEQAYFTGLNNYWRYDSELDFKLSIHYFNRAVELDPEFILAWAKLASAHCQMYHFHFDHTEERLQMAWEALKNARAIESDNPDVLHVEGFYYYVTYDYRKALEKYKMAEGRVMDAPDLYVCMAALYRRQQNLEKAKEYFLKADELSPQNKIFTLELAETYLLLRDYKQAEAYFRKYSLMGGTQYEGLVDNVYLYLIWKKENVKSRQALQERKELSGSRPYGLLTFHEVRIDLIDSDFSAALEALHSEPADSVHHQFIYRPKSLSFAEVYTMQNKAELANRYYDTARVYLETRIAESPEDSRLYSSLGIAYAGLGRKDEAIQAGQRGVDLMPITKDFYRGIFRLEDLARIYTMVEEYDKALEILNKLLSKPGLISVNLLKKDPAWEKLWDRDDFNKMLNDHS